MCHFCCRSPDMRWMTYYSVHCQYWHLLLHIFMIEYVKSSNVWQTLLFLGFTAGVRVRQYKCVTGQLTSCDIAIGLTCVYSPSLRHSAAQMPAHGPHPVRNIQNKQQKHETDLLSALQLSAAVCTCNSCSRHTHWLALANSDSIFCMFLYCSMNAKRG